ncbi:MAG: hypothetical protein BroJett011_19900 [Chloroflexota bacterium]|nr:MAG: hypothetical protein BroJett011_19900 [Chloroflexota bacterium]
MTDQLELKQALKDLIGWSPEVLKPSDFLGVTGYPVEDITQEDDEANFLSEAFLYVALGKEDARSLLFRVRRVCEAAGFKMYDLEREIAQEKQSYPERWKKHKQLIRRS